MKYLVPLAFAICAGLIFNAANEPQSHRLDGAAATPGDPRFIDVDALDWPIWFHDHNSYTEGMSGSA